MNTGKQINAMVVVLFLALIAIGAYVVWDPFRSNAAEDKQLETTVTRAATTFALNCRLCHGDRGQGGANGGRLGVAPALDRADLQGILDGTFDKAAHAAAVKLVTNTITCGRAGTAMPTWGATQGGTLNEEQIRQLAVLITQGTLADGRSTWDLAQEHADAIDAKTTGNAKLNMPDGLSADASEMVVSSAELFNRDQYVRIDDERLYIPGYRLDVQRGVNATAAAEHAHSTAIAEAGVETGETVKLDIAPEDTTIYVSGVHGVEVEDILRSINVGDTIQIDGEQMTVTDSASGIPTTGQSLAEEIGKTPKHFLVSGADGIEEGAVIRLNGELMTVDAIRDDGDPDIQVAAPITGSAETIAVSNPAFFGADYVMRIGDELVRVVKPVDTGQTLGDTIGHAQTTFTVSGSAGLEQDMIVRIDSELMRITELTPATVEVTRHAPLEDGGDDTAAAAHDAGTAILQTGVAEGADPNTGQTLLEAVGAEDTTFTVSGTTGLAVEQTFQLGDEAVVVTNIEPASVRVERAVEDTDLASHSRRTAIYNGNSLKVERGFGDSNPAAHDEGDPINMFELDVKRKAEGSALQEHSRSAEIFLGEGLMVARGVKSTEAAAHDDGALVRNFPTAPDTPATTAQACGQIAVAAPTGPTPTAGPTATPGGQEVTIVAKNIAFDLGEITISAGSPVAVHMDNQDDTSHNFSVYKEEGGDEIARGAICAGPCKEDVQVPALDAGTYYFQCDVHALQMNGDYIVE